MKLIQLPNGFWVPPPCTDCDGEGNNADGSYCQECCEHEFDPGEGYMCLNCNKEGMEDMCAAAEAACEGDR